ncbi:hypothetical protein [Luteibacter sp. CQ10]|uniref:hypothetical protein n=1 Tax=Luteibacter sp. CQ10 TaxID=2805821 RepID=UPI0034A121EF
MSISAIASATNDIYRSLGKEFGQQDIRNQRSRLSAAASSSAGGISDMAFAAAAGSISDSLRQDAMAKVKSLTKDSTPSETILANAAMQQSQTSYSSLAETSKNMFKDKKEAITNLR